MNAKRIIPCLDVKDGKVVKGVNFINFADVGDPVALAKYYNDEKADELVFLDITASAEGRNIMVDLVRRTAEQVFIPITIGGGLRTIDDIINIISVGADKVSINSAAIKNPDLIDAAADRFGRRCTVVAIDAKKREGSDGYDIYLNGGRENTGKDAVEWAAEVERRGAGEILVTSMDCDGTKSGYDITLTKQIAKSVNIPVIASGGAGNMAHFYDVLTDGEADAALAASLFHFKEINIKELKQYLAEKGVAINL